MHNTSKNTDLTLLLNALATSFKQITSAVKRAGISDLYGLSGDENCTGDQVKKLDVISNEIMINALSNSGVCCLLVSEENEDPIVVEEGKRGRYCVAFDPLDGSSNIDCNVSVGTIFGIYEKRDPSSMKDVGEADILRDGNAMVCAGYCVYSSAVELVISFKNRPVHCFCLDPNIGEFIYTRQLEFPSDGGKKIYSCNEGNSKHWSSGICNSVDKFKSMGYAARYVGSMVADVHRTMLYGGVFIYPADGKNKKGKLRILYEGYPMAMLIEQSGGVASTGSYMGKVQRIMDVLPTGVHDKCPIVMGGRRDVNVVMGCLRGEGEDAPDY